MSLTLRPKRLSREVFYGWRLVPVAGFMQMISSVPLFHGMGLWFVALESSFGWSRTQLSFAFAFTRVEGGILGPVEGYLTDRLGTRRVVLIGMLILGVGFLILGQVNHLWMFYVAFMIMALGQGLGGWLPMNVMLNNWFVRGRAAAMGWSNAISRLGGLLLIPTIAWGVDPDADNLGWRMTATILGIFTLVIAIPVSRVIRNRPEDYGLRPDGDPPILPGVTRAKAEDRTAHTPTVRPASTDLTVKQAIRTPAFWLIAFGHGFTSMVIVGMMAHLAPLLSDQGFSVQTAGLVVTAYTAVSMVFQVIGGYIGDRMPKNIAIFIFTTIQAASVVVIAFASSSLFMTYLFAVMFGIGFGGRNPLTTSMRGDYFGRSSFGMIMGVSQVPMNVLLLIAPTFAGLMRDIQGTYTTAFLVLASLSFLGGVLFLMARKPQLTQASPQPETARQTG